MRFISVMYCHTLVSPVLDLGVGVDEKVVASRLVWMGFDFVVLRFEPTE
jgi:hypothetical protein